MDKRILGPDVSNWQRNVNWKAVKAYGAPFAFCKATEGLDYVDPSFKKNWEGIKAAGIPVRGAYHFARPQLGRSGKTEALHFLKTVGKTGPGDLLVLDIETHKPMPKFLLKRFIKTFVREVHRETGRRPIIYTGHWWRENVPDMTSLGCRLWLAAYTSLPDPFIPKAWKGDKRGFFWQFTDGSYGKEPHVMPGIGACDINEWRGTLADLHELARVPSAPKPKPPSSPPPKYPGTPLKKGSKGYAVRQIQRKLFKDPKKIDGIFGSQTQRAVKRFQGLKRLSIDGVVGPKTWKKLMEKK